MAIAASQTGQPCVIQQHQKGCCQLHWVHYPPLEGCQWNGCPGIMVGWSGGGLAPILQRHRLKDSGNRSIPHRPTLCHPTAPKGMLPAALGLLSSTGGLPVESLPWRHGWGEWWWTCADSQTTWVERQWQSRHPRQANPVSSNSAKRDVVSCIGSTILHWRVASGIVALASSLGGVVADFGRFSNDIG